jgi:hypothetical protein
MELRRLFSKGELLLWIEYAGVEHEYIFSVGQITEDGFSVDELKGFVVSMLPKGMKNIYRTRLRNYIGETVRLYVEYLEKN